MNPDSESAAETSRLRAAFAAASLDAVPAEDCPPAERLWAAARAEPDAGDVRELIEHVATCGACAEAWRLARELDPAGEAAERRPSARRGWPRRAWPAVAAAAAVVLVVGLTWRQLLEDPADVVRGAAPQELRRIPEQDGRLSRREPVMRWPAAAGASYDLLVMTEDLDRIVVDVQGLDAADYRIPEDDLSALAAGTRLVWLVKVESADGFSSMPTHRFTLVE